MNWTVLSISKPQPGLSAGQRPSAPMGGRFASARGQELPYVFTFAYQLAPG